MSQQGLGLGLGGLGRDKGFLCRDRVLLALCFDRGRCRDKMWSRSGGFMLRPRNCVATGWHNGHALVCTTNEFCHDREFSFATDFLKFSVVIENSLSR